MKKLLTITLATLMALSLVACAPTEKTDTPVEDSSNSSSQAEDANGDEEPVVSTTHFGEVSAIVGNEITLSIGKNDLFGGDDALGGDFTTEEGDDAVTDIPAVGMVPAITGETGAIGESGLGEGMDIEYTGETLDIVIPAGTEITNMFGEVVDFTSIKKGSIVETYINSETMLVEKVIVWQ